MSGSSRRFVYDHGSAQALLICSLCVIGLLMTGAAKYSMLSEPALVLIADRLYAEKACMG